MKKTHYLLCFVAVAMLACGGGPSLNFYAFLITNESAHEVRVTFYNNENTIIFSNTFTPSQGIQICNIENNVFISFLCAGDSVVVEFDNNKGYICSKRLNSNSTNLCFQNKSFYGASQEDFERLGGSTYNFIITEEDYENAFELPE